MEKINIHEAKTHLSKHLKTVEETGGEITICRSGKPVAKLVPVDEREQPKKKRKLGFGKGKWNVPDDIKEPFREELEEAFGFKF